MLGYRSFFRFRDEPHAHQALDGQLFQWLRSKRWDAERLVEGDTQRVGADATGTLVRADADGAQSTRFVFDQDGTGGQWTTSVTLHLDDGGTAGWVWFDIDCPPSQVPKPPRVAGELLRSVTGRDGDHVLTGEAAVARRAQIPDLHAALTDPRRRGLLFLAGTDDHLPLDKWAEFVRGILHDTVGLASAHVLDTETTALLNAELPASHRIAPGTVRTFRPGVDLDDPVDGVRHRYLTTERIVRDRSYVLRKLLAHQARELSTSAPLPRDAIAVDELLRERLDAALLDSAAPATTPPARPSGNVVVMPPPATVLADMPAPTLLTGHPVFAELSAVVRDVLGTDTVDADAIRTLGALAGRARSTAAARDSLQERMRRIEAERKEAAEEADLLRMLLEDEQIDRALAENERADAERHLLHVRTELARLGQAEAAWSEPDEDPRDVRPESLDDLLARLGELDHIVFTGDEELTHGLDKHDPMGAWAGRTWEVLRALDDYCRVIADGTFHGDVHRYLTYTPIGCHGFSPGAHVPVESESVRNAAKFRNPRMLPVPADVDPSGTVFMDAHFRIGGRSRISPRMHYFDDAAGTGRIYVGYLGPHLPNTLTN